MTCIPVRAFLAFIVLVAPSAACAANFSDVMPGARPMGMGNAYTAVAEGPYAMYYNPAGLAGSDFIQLAGSLGRMMSPIGPLAFEDMVYTRPFPVRPGSTVGAAYYNERQDHGGDKDQMMFHYSEAFRLPPEFSLTNPVKTGANAKILSVNDRVGLALDGGVLFESNFGLKSGISILNLTPSRLGGVPYPWMTLATAYTWNKRVTFSGDLRIRRSLTEFYPGIEASFFQGLLMARMGKGLSLDEISQVAYGLGFNFSPLIIDMAMTLPFNGFTRPGGAYQLSMTYKFGAPPFSGRFVGAAAREAEDLKAEILELEDRRNTLQTQVATAETNKTAADGQVRAFDARLRALQDQVREAQHRLDEITYKTQTPKLPPAEPAVQRVPKVPAAPVFPRRYQVKLGDTLRSIAKEEYGDPNLWELIYKANREKIERGLPQEGTELIIPAPVNR